MRLVLILILIGVSVTFLESCGRRRRHHTWHHTQSRSHYLVQDCMERIDSMSEPEIKECLNLTGLGDEAL